MSNDNNVMHSSHTRQLRNRNRPVLRAGTIYSFPGKKTWRVIEWISISEIRLGLLMVLKWIDAIPASRGERIRKRPDYTSSRGDFHPRHSLREGDFSLASRVNLSTSGHTEASTLLYQFHVLMQQLQRQQHAFVSLKRLMEQLPSIEDSKLACRNGSEIFGMSHNTWNFLSLMPGELEYSAWSAARFVLDDVIVAMRHHILQDFMNKRSHFKLDRRERRDIIKDKETSRVTWTELCEDNYQELPRHRPKGMNIYVRDFLTLLKHPLAPKEKLAEYTALYSFYKAGESKTYKGTIPKAHSPPWPEEKVHSVSVVIPAQQLKIRDTRVTSQTDCVHDVLLWWQIITRATGEDQLGYEKITRFVWTSRSLAFSYF